MDMGISTRTFRRKMFFLRNLRVGSKAPYSCHAGVVKYTFACACQGHFSNQVFLEYLDSQALVLTHENASQTEQLPYLGVLLAPTPVLNFYGRCATRNPPCHKNDAVFYWWQDLHKICNDIFLQNFWAHFVGSMDSTCPQDVGLPT